MTITEERNRVVPKRSRVIVRKNAPNVPDINDVIIDDVPVSKPTVAFTKTPPPKSVSRPSVQKPVQKPASKPVPKLLPESSSKLRKPIRVTEPERPESRPAKKRTKTATRAGTVEPNWNIRRNPDDEDEGNIEQFDIDLKDLFKPKQSKQSKQEKSIPSQGVAVGDQDMPDVGVAFPSFCLEMFTGHSVLGFSSCYALAGPTGAFKSHLALEIARWVSGIGGVILLAENESKYNADMARAVMGHHRGGQVWLCKCKSFNQVQRSLVNGINRRDSYNTTAPMMQIIDSVVGNATESSAKKLKEQGEVERAFPANALAAANFLPDYMPMLAEKPYLGLWITHSKDIDESMGPYKRTITTLKGGGRWEYCCRMAFILRRISDSPKYEDTTWMVKLKLQLKKDAGVRTFQLPVNVRCTHDVVYDEKRNDYFSVRKLRFCWDEATINLWLKPETAGYPPFYKSAIHDITGFTQVKVSGRNCFIAPKIGIGKDDATRDCIKIIDALYNAPDVLDRLRAELGIQKGIGMQTNDNFADLTEQAQAVAVRRASLLKNKKEVTYIKRVEIKEDGKSTTERADME